MRGALERCKRSQGALKVQDIRDRYPDTDKLAIMRIMEGKCKKDGRKGFEFLQAHYLKKTGRIDALPLALLEP